MQWAFPGESTGVSCISFSRRSFQPRDQNDVSCIAGGFFTTEPLGKSPGYKCPFILSKVPMSANPSVWIQYLLHQQPGLETRQDTNSKGHDSLAGTSRLALQILQIPWGVSAKHRSSRAGPAARSWEAQGMLKGIRFSSQLKGAVTLWHGSRETSKELPPGSPSVLPRDREQIPGN